MKQCCDNLLRILVLICFGATGSVALGAGEPRQYEVELLVFQNLINSDNGEVWPVDYSHWFEEPEPGRTDQPQNNTRVVWLPASSFRLGAERNALGRSSQYRPVTYLAWRQTVLDRDSAQAIPVPVDNTRSGSYIDGTVKVAVERYLHLYLDLQFHPDTADLEADMVEIDLPEIRLSEHRRMRSKEVHYFDNPRFGVIALITPYEPEQEVQP